MSIRRSQYLLMTLVSLLAARGLAPDSLDTWRAWVTFKQFARQVAEEPDPGVSVQLTSTASGVVERHPDYANIVTEKPISTDVYWEDA